MHNWDYPKTAGKTADPKWRLGRLLTYGLNGERLNRKELEQYLLELKIPDDTRALFELLLWNKPF